MSTTATAPASGNQAAPLPGQYFMVPGIPGGSTQWTEQDETTVGNSTTRSQGAQVQVLGIQQMRQTDVVMSWEAQIQLADTYTAGTGQTLTGSAYAPWNSIGATKLLIQNQYASIDVESGIDIYIFGLIRPFDTPSMFNGNNAYANPAGSPVGGTATGYADTALAQANQVNAAAWSTSSTTYNLVWRLPAGQWFDRYTDLAVDGTPLSMGTPALVSPQYMAGTTRVITLSMFMNPGFGTTSDQGPATTTALVASGDTASTYSGTSLLRLRRRAVYAGNPAVQPPVYAWQYRQKTQRFSLSGVSQATIQIPLDTGQLLGTYIRMFDPSADSSVGAPINVNTVTRFNLQYGSGLYYYDSQTNGNMAAGTLAQAQFTRQHGSLLPQGVLAIDLALDERGQLTNAKALNTLTTAGILIYVSFSGTLSATAYAVLGTESLVYVS